MEKDKSKKPSRKSLYDAINRYQKKHYKCVKLQLSIEKDKDILSLLNACKSKNDYIKKAIRFYTQNKSED